MLSDGFILLLTKNSKSDFSKKVVKAIEDSGYVALVIKPGIGSLAQQVDRNINLAIIDQDDFFLATGNYFFKVLRKFQPTVPVLLASSRK